MLAVSIKNCLSFKEDVMKSSAIFFLLVICIAFPRTAEAQPDIQPFQLAIWDPVQLFDSETTIHGVRLNLIYGVNQDMFGVDLGFVNRVKGESKGLQYGFVNFIESDFTGWQDGSVNIVKGRFSGLQTGLFNSTNHVKGLQFGLVNITETLHGLQIGLININKSGDPIKFLPIVNWSF